MKIFYEKDIREQVNLSLKTSFNMSIEYVTTV